MSESVVFCEGYHDRAFWSGWLEHLGCTDPGQGSPRRTVYDLAGEPVVSPQFGYRTPTQAFVRLVACHGRRGVRDAAGGQLRKEADRWKQGASEPRLARLILSIDPDLEAEELSAESGFTITNLQSWLWRFDESARAGERGGAVLVFGGKTAVSLLCWEAGGDAVPGVPNKQTLERLVCSAIVAAYPERGEPIQRWLESRPNPPNANPKEYAWSHMAGWYARFDRDPFYKMLWKDENVAAELQRRLEECGAWRIVEELAK
jgi:hypothetical protein